MQYKPEETQIYALYNASKTINILHNILQFILTKKITKKNSRKGRLLSAVLFRGGRGYRVGILL